MIEKKVRSPRQERSIEKREKILRIAKELFSEKVYFNVTTNEIAKTAGLSVGTLYSYFASKDDILITLLERYNHAFIDKIFTELSTKESLDLFAQAPKKWLHSLVEQLLRVEDTKFHAQIEMLAYAVPQAKSLLEEHNEKIKTLTYQCFLDYQNKQSDISLKTLSLVVFDFISALVDELLYHDHSPKEFEQIKKTGIDSLYLIINTYLNENQNKP
ncbi:TetR/AcrR family transcriptional regulator [Streptococcus tangpeifui]|uniref:TetR/AcrR family transcriptional regulator n=1 Tax=Streptococcus tangpeifui TaxID=2709400 RepID=UPI0013EE07A7|nr:TetR/AcrR family transcriptional regulator [Streptococcus sp. ZJ373]